MNISMFKDWKFTPVQILSIGFASVILIGALLLKLPISSSSGEGTPFVDCLFVSTSAVCVTGLVTVDTGTHWSTFGHVIIIFLIQIGGLGFMSFATLFSLILGKKITLKERLVMQEAMNTFDLQGLVKMAKYILVFTFSVETIGAIILASQFIPVYGFVKGLAYGFFHSISSFCNAGIDLFGEFRSITIFNDNPLIVLTIGSLIVIGGLGFAVWADIYNFKSIRKLSLHSKIAIIVTLVLIFGGAFLMFVFEFNNPATMGNMSLMDKVVNSIFASITPRTAGYNSISTSDMTGAGRLLTIMLMFIGGSPGSTAGGIKTTTLSIIVLALVSVVKGREDTVIFKKRLNKDLILKSFLIAFLGLLLVGTVTMILSITEVGASLEYILYEATSAFATVGLTLGLTTKLSVLGKLIIAFTMYLGRVGPLTVALAFGRDKKANLVRYPEDKILVG